MIIDGVRINYKSICLKKKIGDGRNIEQLTVSESISIIDQL